MSKQTTSVAAQPMKLKRPRGAIRRAIVAGIWTAKQAHAATCRKPSSCARA